MKCNEILGTLPDLAAGLVAATPVIEEHLRTCAGCAAKLDEMRKTMALLDEWQAPEPSPYFDVRLQARLREEAARPGAGWMAWFRKPALALSLALLMGAGILLISKKNGAGPSNAVPEVALTQSAPGTAVGDLQALDNNDDLYANFDVLDDLQVQRDVTANP